MTWYHIVDNDSIYELPDLFLLPNFRRPKPAYLRHTDTIKATKVNRESDLTARSFLSSFTTSREEAGISPCATLGVLWPSILTAPPHRSPPTA
ncbi:hypothetical protein AFLA_005927 [Aspergillus flavus NRRL3357]|nr:hypothetical protein AFLA_005927 [Aspergillus flavus NRRL3357]